MCVVSMVADHYMNRWPIYTAPTTPAPLVWPQYTITPDQWAEYTELKRKAAEYDARTGQPDCEKPGVTAWEQAQIDAHGLSADAAVPHAPKAATANSVLDLANGILEAACTKNISLSQQLIGDEDSDRL